MASTTNIVTESGNTWTVGAPDGVTVSQAAPGGQLNISVDYDAEALYSGIVSLDFTEPAGNTNDFGLRLPVVFSFENNLGTALNTFELFTAMEVEPAVRDSSAVHPTTYAHFHGVQATTFGPLTTEVFVDANRSNVAAFGPAGATPVPGWISGTGTVNDGQTVTSAPFVLHQFERPAAVDNFDLAFFARLPDGQQVAAVTPATLSEAEGDSGTTAYSFTVRRAGSPDDINTTAPSFEYAVVGTGANAADAADFSGGALPSGTASFTAGQRETTVTVLVAGDTALEADETFGLVLSNASPGLTLVDRDAASATIRNDDAATPTDPCPCADGDVDWTALSERVLAYYEASGQWGLIDDWLGCNPPDGGASDYCVVA